MNDNGHRAVGKIDYRGVVLLMQGSEIDTYYWSKEAKSKSFTLPLNIAEHHSDAKNVIGVLMTNAENITNTCCERSAITPFSWNYWRQCLSCENAKYTREDRVSQNFFGPDYRRKTEEDVEEKKKEFLANCDEVRLPAKFKQVETINIGGK